jgi:tetratricopeptide (TPR) repeat protein
VDTHPSLQDRLAALGAPVSVGQWSLQVERPGNPTAAESMLGANAEAWYRRLNKEWSSAVQESWKDHHNEIQEQKKRLAELRSNGTPESLNDQDSWEFASLVCRIDGDEVALPLLQRIVYRNPKHVSANFTLGRILLERGNADGVARLAEAMRGDPECTLNACYLIEQFHRENRNPDEAERFRQRALEYSELSVEAEKERNNITAQDAFSPHDLDDEFVVELQAHLKRYDRLAAAYLVRKEVRIWPERPAFVLGLVANSSWFRSQNDADVTMFNQIVQNAPLPAGTYVILLDSSRKTLRKEMESVAGSRV